METVSTRESGGDFGGTRLMASSSSAKNNSCGVNAISQTDYLLRL